MKSESIPIQFVQPKIFHCRCTIVLHGSLRITKRCLISMQRPRGYASRRQITNYDTVGRLLRPPPSPSCRRPVRLRWQIINIHYILTKLSHKSRSPRQKWWQGQRASWRMFRSRTEHSSLGRREMQLRVSIRIETKRFQSRGWSKKIILNQRWS